MMRAVPGCVVLYPCDGVSAGQLVIAAAAHIGMTYMRTSRPKTPVIYTAADEFVIGGSKVLRESPEDVATVVAAGVTVFEALAAHDELRRSGMHLRVIDAYCVQPIDVDALVRAGQATGRRLVTVEDHYAAGGLGDAVSDAVAAHGNQRAAAGGARSAQERKNRPSCLTGSASRLARSWRRSPPRSRPRRSHRHPRSLPIHCRQRSGSVLVEPGGLRRREGGAGADRTPGLSERRRVDERLSGDHDPPGDRHAARGDRPAQGRGGQMRWLKQRSDFSLSLWERAGVRAKGARS